MSSLRPGQLRQALLRELACDHLAMSLSGGDAAEYANTLVQVVSHASEPPTIRSQAAVSAQLDGVDEHVEKHRADAVEHRTSG